MPRPLIRTSPGPTALTVAAGPGPAPAATGSTGLLTTTRSSRFADALDRLDAHASVSRAELDRIVGDVAAEYAAAWATVPLGVVGPCFLGPPFDAHTLTWDEDVILEHFETARPFPGALQRARRLAVSRVYRAVEVYADRLVCVHADGTTTAVEG